MLKQIILFLLIFTNLAFAEKNQLTIYTYSGFAGNYGPGKILKEEFEKTCECEINFSSNDDAVSVFNRLKMEGESTKADILLGIDNNLLQNAINTNLFVEHNLTNKYVVLEQTNINFVNKFFIPFDFSYFAFVYNAQKTQKVPKSLDEFLNGDFGSLIYQDPRSSTPGFGFLLTMQKLYANNTNQAFRKLGEKTTTITKSWSEAYNLFLKGESDFVLSYLTSPLYHKIAEKNDNYKAILFDEGNYLQIELAGILKISKQQVLAQQFLEFLLTEKAQTIIAMHNWMLPVAENNLEKDFIIDLPKTTLQFESSEILENQEQWLENWQESLM